MLPALRLLAPPLGLAREALFPLRALPPRLSALRGFSTEGEVPGGRAEEQDAQEGRGAGSQGGWGQGAPTRRRDLGNSSSLKEFMGEGWRDPRARHMQQDGEPPVVINYPRSKDDLARIGAFLRLPGILIRNVPKSAISRDILRFVTSKGITGVEKVFCLRNDNLQPIGMWMVITSTQEDSRILLRAFTRGETKIGALKPEIVPKKSISERVFQNNFFFELHDAGGRAVLIRGIETDVRADFLRNQFRSYEMIKGEKNFIHIQREHRNSPPTHFYVVKFVDESEAHRFVRENDNTILLGSSHSQNPVRVEVLY